MEVLLERLLEVLGFGDAQAAVKSRSEAAVRIFIVEVFSEFIQGMGVQISTRCPSGSRR